MNVRAAALAWAATGTCVLPTKQDGSKSPDRTWRGYVHHPGQPIPAAPAVAIVETWFDESSSGVGLILGAVSGNLEMIELEGAAVDEGLLARFRSLMVDHGLSDLWSRLCAGYVERTPKGGLHFIYRVSDGPALPNTKLACRPATAGELAIDPQNRIRVLIETRGEGGHCIVAPSNGKTHPTGGSWVITVGTPGVVCSISALERDAMFAVAGLLNSVSAVPRPLAAQRSFGSADLGAFSPDPPGYGGVLSPLDDYETRVDWADVLLPAGWAFVDTQMGTSYWRRPGKDIGAFGGWDHSASTGYWGERDCMYVWSTSTELPTGEWMTKGRVYAHLHHGGDMSEAARSLYEQGYGTRREALTSPPAPSGPLVVPGCLDPASPGFDPVAWAHSRNESNPSGVPVPTVATGEFEALDWVALDTEEYVQEWVVEGFLPARRAMALYSAPKVGKSLLMLEMAAHVSRGTEFMGMKTTPTTVLYFDHENDPRGDTWPRLKAMGFTPSDLCGLKVLSFPNMATLDTAAGGQAMIRAVAQFSAGLVIIDTVSRTIAGEENSNDTWLQLYLHTGKLLKAAQIPCIRLDHSGKDETKGARGGSAKSGDVDAIWQLSGLGDRKFMLKLDAGRMQFPTEILHFVRESGPLRSRPDRGRAGDGTFNKNSETAMRIGRDIEALLKAADTGLLRSQIKDNVRGNNIAVPAVLDRLVEREFVITEPNGRTTVYRWNADRKGDWDVEDAVSEDPFS